MAKRSSGATEVNGFIAVSDYNYLFASSDCNSI